MKKQKSEHKAFFYPVRKVPMEELMQPGAIIDYNSKLTHAVVMDTPEGPRMVNACSKGYTVITNEEIFKPLSEYLGKSFDLEQKGHINNYSKFYMDYILHDKELAVTPTDTIFPRLRVQNSYDGSLRYQFTLGFHRLVCSNGLTIPVSDIKEVHMKMRHTPAALGKWEKVVQIATDFLENANKMLGGYKELASNKLTMEEAITRMQDVLENTKAPSKKLESMTATLHADHERGLPITDWLVYNAINYELNHGSSRAAPHKKDKVDAQVLDYLLEN